MGTFDPLIHEQRHPGVPITRGARNACIPCVPFVVNAARQRKSLLARGLCRSGRHALAEVGVKVMANSFGMNSRGGWCRACLAERVRGIATRRKARDPEKFRRSARLRGIRYEDKLLTRQIEAQSGILQVAAERYAAAMREAISAQE